MAADSSAAAHPSIAAAATSAAASPAAAESSVAAVLAGVPAGGRFTLRLRGGGRFGRVAWAGVDGDLPRLASLREDIATVAPPSDGRPFSPHLTVSYHGDAAVWRSLETFVGEPWEVTEFALVRSVEGRYETIETWPLH